MTRKFSKVATKKNIFSSVFVIGTTYFDKYYLFYVITGSFMKNEPVFKQY